MLEDFPLTFFVWVTTYHDALAHKNCPLCYEHVLIVVIELAQEREESLEDRHGLLIDSDP